MKLTAEDISVEPCHAVVAYCDVTGFMAWIRQSATSGSDVAPFIREMKFAFLEFQRVTGYDVIPVGDGIIVVDDGKPAVLEFIKCLTVLQKKMEVMIRRSPWPRPTGFRIRIVAGGRYRVALRGMLDFIGDAMNLGARLLEVMRFEKAIIHASAVELMTKAERRSVSLKPLTPEGRAPRGVEEQDIKALCAFALRRAK